MSFSSDDFGGNVSTEADYDENNDTTYHTETIAGNPDLDDENVHWLGDVHIRFGWHLDNNRGCISTRVEPFVVVESTDDPILGEFFKGAAKACRNAAEQMDEAVSKYEQPEQSSESSNNVQTFAANLIVGIMDALADKRDDMDEATRAHYDEILASDGYARAKETIGANS